MTLELIDFVVETDGVDLEDFPPEVQDRINDELKELTEGGPGNSPEPEDPPQSIVVDAGGEGDYDSIQTAIDDDEGATSGDVIFVEPGEYDESVTVDVNDLTLEGPNAGIAGDSDERGAEAVITQGVLIDDADNVTLNGFTVEQDVAGQDGQESVVRVGENLGVEDRTFVTAITLSNNVITANPTTDDTLTAVGIEGAVDMAVTNNQITQTSFTGQLVGVGNYESEITNLEISQNTIETQVGVALGGSNSELSRTATISENTINSTEHAVAADGGSDLTIDGNSINGIEGESFEEHGYQQIGAFGGEVTITNNDFTAGADTSIYVGDTISLDTEAILNGQGNTFDPDAEIDGNGYIVPTSQ